ncbi:MAG: VCBS repeat-containing protein [Maribacter sp.]|nr:VCBS repeat-containing protein [Maribacter sp.]
MARTPLYFLVLFVLSCSSNKEEKGQALFNTYCTSCHIAPSLNSLPKNLWDAKVLPEMGARLGMGEPGYDPMKGLSFMEQEAMLKTGVYPPTPLIKREDWGILKKYVLDMAPDSLPRNAQNNEENELIQFSANPISLDTLTSSLYTYLKFDPKDRLIYLGDFSGRLSTYDYLKDSLIAKVRLGIAITDYKVQNGVEYVTTVGYLDPSSIPSGKIFIRENNVGTVIPEILHRPVHTLIHDLNKDGVDELVVSEFGDLTGALSLLKRKADTGFEKVILLDQPGSIRVLAEDMNNDGKEDLVALTAQGDETITILYQEADLNFRPEKVIRFSPIYGSSWFELVDYDGDGDKDIVTVNGDNADKTYVQKPYHGMRIYLNNGNNEFEQVYFYPLNGATRVIAKDFDKDGDIDFALLSTFPDYTNHPNYSFVYLENKEAKNYKFIPFTFSDSKAGRWFLMDSGDVDNDGDEDIILSAFSYSFTPAPEAISEFWKEKKVDLLVLENKFIGKQ